LETVLVSVQDRCTVCAKRTKAQISFWMHWIVHLGDELKWKLVLVHFEAVLVSMQEWCTICAKRTIGSEIILDAPDGTPT
jgi:hypothetical protein